VNKKRPESWQNYENYRKGKEQLKNAVLQHPEEDSKTSIYDFIKKETKRKLWVIPFNKFKKGDK
jgi:hypothetical protein